MNYNDAFAIDDVSFLERKKETGYSPKKYELQNHDYHEPKLVDDFYLKYFTRELLFEIDILKVKEFLQYQYDYCDDPELFFNVLDLKILPKIEEFLELSDTYYKDIELYNEIKLEDGFVESEGVIHHMTYDYSLMSNVVVLNKSSKSDLSKRKKVVESFIELYMEEENAPSKPLKWVGGPSQLAIIVKELVDKGYIQADMHRGDINCKKLARDLIKAFDLKEENPIKTLETYLSAGNKRYAKAKAKFDDMNFFIPNKDYTS